jgi:DNA mismatch endonuclease (patch repair protein)
MKRLSVIRTKSIPSASSEAVSKTMRGNKSSRTTPELILRKGLTSAGIRGYRLNWDRAPGRPDIAFPGRRIAVFVQGCFWHSCPYCKISHPKTNRSYWLKKLRNNVIRDQNIHEQLMQAGWHVFIAWECQIKSDLKKIVRQIGKFL